jgi:hypothetical protein
MRINIEHEKLTRPRTKGSAKISLAIFTTLCLILSLCIFIEAYVFEPNAIVQLAKENNFFSIERKM